MARQVSNIAVCDHSTPDKNYIIFSVYKNEKTDIPNHNLMKQLLDFNNIGYQELTGCYNGTIEKSFIVNYSYFDYITIVSKTYRQESVLILKSPAILLNSHKHGLYEANLLYLDTNIKEFIGYLRATKKETALKQASYSYREDIDTYFIVTPEDTTIMSELKQLGY